MKFLTLLLACLVFVGCSEKKSHKPKIKKEETSYEYTPTIIDTNGITFIATEHNTFECAVSIHEMIYKVTSEPGSVALIKNNVVIMTDNTSEKWIMVNPSCALVERE